ncbi:hypothetical protein D9M68_979120 [compost metagenome]
MRTERNTAALSIGTMVRKSITSASMPASANSCAASTDFCTIWLKVTMVRSPPSRTTLASPNGMV